MSLHHAAALALVGW